MSGVDGAIEQYRASMGDLWGGGAAGVPTALTKRDNVALVTEQKKARLQGYNEGAAADVGLRNGTIDPNQGLNRPDIETLDANRQGRADYMADTTSDRTDPQTIGDSSLSLINGAMQGVLGIGAIAGGAVDYLAGSNIGGSVSGLADNINQGVQSLKSDQINQQVRAKSFRDALTTEHNAALEQEEIAAGSNKTEAGLRRFGRDVIRSFTNSNAALTGEGISSGLGSFAVGGVAGKGLKALGFGRAAMPASIGALEGGGAYTATVNEVMAMDHQTLLDGSPEYARLVGNGVPESEARQQIANRAGLIAGAIQAPVGVLTGTLVSKFEGNPLAAKGIRTILGNLGREGFEESIQGASGTAAQNYGVKSAADINRELAAGLGQATGEGFQYGLGTAGVAQIPSVPGALGRAAVDGARRVAEPIIAGAKERLSKINDSFGADSPTSTANMGANVEALRQKFGVSDFKEFMKSHLAAKVGTSQQVENAQGETVEITGKSMGDYVDQIHGRMSIDPAAEAELESSLVIKDAISQSTNRFDVMSRVSAIAGDKNASPEDRRDAQIYLLSQLNQNNELLDSDVAQAIALAPDDESDPTLKELRVYESALNNLKNNPEVKAALGQAQKAAEAITVEQVNDPQTAVAAAKFAELAPGSVKPEVINRVLLHAEQGTAPISETSRQALEATRAVNEAEVQHTTDNASISSTGAEVKKNPNIVSQSVRRRGDDRESGMLSGRDYQTRILAAWRAGNKDEAKRQLGNLQKFAQHLSNKVGALNESLATGNGIAKDGTVKYQSLNNRTKKFSKSIKGLYVNPEIASHVAFAQQVESDAKAITNLANKLAEIFGELGLKPIELTPLAPELQGNAKKISDRFGAEKWGETRRKGKPAPYAKSTTGTVDKAVDSSAADAAPTPREVSSRETETKVEAKVKEKPVATKPEPDPKPVPVAAEPVQIEQAVEPVSKPEQPIEPELVDTSTVKGFFGKLFTDAGRVKNYFLESYVFRKDSSRLVGDLTPVKTVFEALRSSAAWKAMAGPNAVGDFTAEISQAYMTYMGNRAQKTKTELVDRLAAELKKSRAGSSFGAMLKNTNLEGRSPMEFNNGKVLNLVEENEDGSLTYNAQLLDTAVLAGLQWMLTANDRTSYRDRKMVAELLGISEDLVQPTDVSFFNTGVPTVYAKRQLRDQIKKFWGVKAAKDARQGYVDGIAEAMAAEIMHGLEAAGLFEQVKGKINEREYIQLVLSEDADIKALRDLPDAIEQAVLTEPEPTFRFGAESSKEPTNQLRNRQAPLTRDQKAMIERESKIPHSFNKPVIDMYEAFGDMLITVFGAGDINPETTNTMDAETIKGKNQTVTGAYKTLVSLVGQAKNQHNGDLDLAKVFYDYEISAVGRLQQQGPNNPQSSKLMREALLSTNQTVDLTDPAMLTLFKLAMAQHFDQSSNGLKPDQARHADIAADVDQLVSNEKFAPMLEMLAKWEKKKAPFTAADVALIKDALGTGDSKQVTPAAMHAALEFARYQNATAEELKAFDTTTYIEADGKTDGPINAMMHMVSGNFTENWISMMEKGGFFVGARSILEDGTPMSLNDFVSLGGEQAIDLYSTAAEITSSHLLETGKRTNPLTKQHMRHMVRLMQELGIGLKITEDGNSIEISRKLVKNPITITIYGSGERGIAGDVVSAMFEEIYARLSKGDALSPAGLEAFKVLSETGVVYNRQGRPYLKEFDKGPNFYPKDSSNQGLEFSRAQKKNLTDNVLKLFVQGPLKAGIEATTGETTNNVGLLRQAIQVQSIFVARQFNEKVHAKLATLKSPTDGLTVEETQEIWDSIKHLSPLIDTGYQTFGVAGTGRANLSDLTKIQEVEAHNRRVQMLAISNGVAVNPDDLRKLPNPVDFGRSLSDKFRTPSEMAAPQNSGVRGIPMMIIGPGDGLMIQNFSADPNRPPSLLVFDGINLGLNDFTLGSEAANRAVAGGWFEGNPLADVAQGFTDFLADVDVSNIDEALHAELNDALVGLNSQLVPKEVLVTMMQRLGPDLTKESLRVQARKNVLKTVGWSIDHMATGMAPHAQAGTVALEGSTPGEIAASLNVLLEAEIKRLDTESSTERPISQDIAPELSSIGELNETSGARTTGLNELRRSVRNMKIPKNQKTMLEAILRALGSSELQITFGTLEQIVADRAAKGLDALDLSGMDAETKVNGMHIGHENQVYLISPTSETLTHELIHASTLGHLDNYYQNDKLGLTSTQIDAIRRLESMMEQWITTNPNEIPVLARKGFTDMVAEVTGHLEIDPAAALNEFMAWSLSNQSLIDAGKQTKVNFFAKLASDIIAAIKDLVWGRGKAPEVGNDLYSNIRFNTLVLMNSTPSIEKQITRSIAFHRTDGGTSNTIRMQAIHDGLFQKMAAYLNSYAPVERPREQARIDAAIDISEDVSRTFTDNGWAMDPQRTQVFQTMVMALATEMQLDGNALARMQQLYAGIISRLTQEDFMVDPTNGGFADRDQAQKKLNALLGVYGTRSDPKGRSTLLPAFLALTVTNEQFRDVLRKIDLPKSLKNDEKTTDAVVENFGTEMMDRLMKLTSGEGRGNVNVMTAIDALTDRMAKQLAHEGGMIQQGWTKGGTFVDLLNDKVNAGLKTFANRSDQILGNVAANSNSKIVKMGANVLNAITSLASETHTEVMAEGINAALNNNSVIPDFLKEVYVEVVGRTTSNATIYDMIKKVRSYVQQTRQEFREQLPRTLAKMFSRPLTDIEYSQMTKGLAKTDIAVLAAGFGIQETLGFLTTPQALNGQIARLETEIENIDPNNWGLRQAKAKELAGFMNGAEAGKNLLRNAHAVSMLYNEIPNGIRKKGVQFDANATNKVDQLITLYALKGLDQPTLDSLKSLAETEIDGLNATISYLIGQRKDEMAKVAGSDRAIVNHYKGHVPFENDAGSQLIVADDSEAPRLEALGFKRVADYKGSRSERNQVSRGYYFTPIRGRAAFKQGIMQQVRKSAYGVDPFTGYTMDSTVAGVIENPNEIAQITRLLRVNGQNGGEALLPIMNLSGDIVAYERSIRPSEHARLEINDHLGEILGIWRGRLAEEHYAEGFNRSLVQNLANMWNRDKQADASQFIDLLGPEAAKDPIYKDAVSLITRDGREMIKQSFPDGKFMVRRDLVNDSVGYRSVSIGDSWTGISRMNPEMQRVIRDVSMSILGKDAFRIMITAEAGLQRFITDAKVTIVVKSIVVPAFNILSNVVQLSARGVPLSKISKGFGQKAAEVDAFLKGRLERQRLEVLERIAKANNDTQALIQYQGEIRAILDANRRLSIWPLVEAGELSSISDTGISHEEVLLSSGKFGQYFDQLTDRLPDSMKTTAKYGMITRDTALFQGLQKSVEFGDFLAKAVLFDHLTINKKMDKAEALARVGEEFVNYDRNAGRQRGYLEDIGLLWFWNFKIRSLKIASSTLRNNPVHAALTMLMPLPGGIGSPITDNALSVLLGGNVGYSIGWDQLLHAHSLNPFWNMAT